MINIYFYYSILYVNILLLTEVFWTFVVANPVKFVILVSRPPVTIGHNFTEPTNSYGIIRYSITWPTCLSRILVTVSSLVNFFLCKLDFVSLADLKCCIVLGPNSSFINNISSRPAKLYPFSTSMDNRPEFPGVNWPITTHKVPNCWESFVPAFQIDLLSLHSELHFAQLRVHSLIVIVSSCFRKLATYVSWTALNGSKDGHNRRVSPYL